MMTSYLTVSQVSGGPSPARGRRQWQGSGMDFEFSTEQLAFVDDVERFLDEHDDPEIFDVTRENMAQIVDTPERRAFMAELGRRGWLGITWPKAYGGSEGDGVYEYLLNESLARRGGPQIGKGVGIIGKTLIAHGSEKLKQEFLPKILRNEVEFAVGYSEPNAGSDAASMQLKASRDGDGWMLNGQKTWTTSAHFAEWYWLGARTDPEAPKHFGITLFLVPLDHPGITIKPIWTMGDERTNEVYLDDVFVHDDYVVGELNKGFQYISEALDLERFTLFAFSPIAQRLEVLTEYVRIAERDGKRLRDDPVVRQRLAQLHTEAEVARGLGLAFVAASSRGGSPPTAEASEYKLYTTEFSRRLADASMDLAGPGSQLRVHTEDAPLQGRAESTYRYTVIDTIGGGASEIQKNIIARRKLGLPKNF
jgi:alkylation response protein AidB-like acyl-CoA dehydrogenase